MYFLIDNTTIILTRSIFSQASELIFSPIQRPASIYRDHFRPIRSYRARASISTVTFLCFESLYLARQLQYFSAHLKFAPICGLHLREKLSRYNDTCKRSSAGKLTPFINSQSLDVVREMSVWCCNTSNLLFTQRCTKLTMGFMFYGLVKHIMKSAERAWHNKCIFLFKGSIGFKLNRF